MARSKPNNLYPVRNLEEANQVLAELGQLKREIAEINAKMNDEIDRIKADAQALAAPLDSRMEALENGLLAFARYNKEELFTKARSKELVYGSIGYRRSHDLATMPKITWKQVLGKLEELGFEEGIRIRRDPNKETLRTWTEERLALIGCLIREKDTFWYEINEQEVSSQ